MLPSLVVGYFGTQDILIVAGIVLVLFGGTKIPQLMRGVGEGIREFRRGADGVPDAPKVKPETSASNGASSHDSALTESSAV